jgi:hypothetical protein
MFTRTRSLILLTISAAFAQLTSWTTERDTREQEFSVDVPLGWKVQGGLLRKGRSTRACRWIWYRRTAASAASFTENPQWQLLQAQITAAGAAAALKTFRMTLEQTEARYRQWPASISKQGQNFSDALNGQTLTLDPSTGQQREVWTGTGSTRWIDGLGNVVSSNLSPGASFRVLQDIGR